MRRIYRKPHKIKRKKSIIKNQFFWLPLLILFLIGGIFYFIFFSQTFKIKEIQIVGNQKVSSENIQELIREMALVKREIIFLINPDKIEAEILSRFPQINIVNLDRKFPNKLIVEIQERKPVAIFYQGENYFLMDREGIIFEKSQLNGDLTKIRAEPKENLFILGEKVIEKDYLEKIFEIEEKLKEIMKIEAKEFIVLADRLTVKTTEGWEIYFNLEGDLAWQLTKLNLVLKERIPPEKRGHLQYIDLRFEKVYIFPETHRR